MGELMTTFLKSRRQERHFHILFIIFYQSLKFDFFLFLTADDLSRL